MTNKLVDVHINDDTYLLHRGIHNHVCGRLCTCHQSKFKYLLIKYMNKEIKKSTSSTKSRWNGYEGTFYRNTLRIPEILETNMPTHFFRMYIIFRWPFILSIAIGKVFVLYTPHKRPKVIKILLKPTHGSHVIQQQKGRQFSLWWSEGQCKSERKIFRYVGIRKDLKPQKNKAFFLIPMPVLTCFYYYHHMIGIRKWQTCAYPNTFITHFQCLIPSFAQTHFSLQTPKGYIQAKINYHFHQYLIRNIFF